MRHKRLIVEPCLGASKPVIYHCMNRVVDRQFLFGDREKERLRHLMRGYEIFSGCQILAYCIMSNHFHIVLEVTPKPANGLTDEELLNRVAAIYPETVVAKLAAELAGARKIISEQIERGEPADDTRVNEIHARYTKRMHKLSEYMKNVTQCFSQWYNIKNERRGHLWEERYKSVLIESGAVTRTTCAYVDLNPVRAGIVDLPEKYRWSSYGEAIGDAGNLGKRAQAGLVRSWCAHLGMVAEADEWKNGVSAKYRKVLMAGTTAKKEEKVTQTGEVEVIITRKGIDPEDATKAVDDNGEIPWASMLKHRIRYFSAGMVLGSRMFVEEIFERERSRFGPNRKDGARKLRGSAALAAGFIWALRDLRKSI